MRVWQSIDMPRGGAARIGEASSRPSGTGRRPNKTSQKQRGTGGNDPARDDGIIHHTDDRSRYADNQHGNNYTSGFNQAPPNQMNAFMPGSGPMPMPMQPQQAASPLDVLMSAIAASAGAGVQQGAMSSMGGGAGMYGMAQMGNMTNLSNQAGMHGPGHMGANGSVQMAQTVSLIPSYYGPVEHHT